MGAPMRYLLGYSALLTIRAARMQSLAVLMASASVLVLCGTPARADDAQIQKLEAQIQQIEARHQAEISALRSEIKSLRKQRPGTVVVTKGPGGAPVPEEPHVIVSTKNGYHLGLATADNQNTIELFGQLNIDTGGYASYRPNAGTATKGLASGVNFRRARIGVGGIFLGDWAYRLVYDLGGNSDGYSPSSNTNASTGLLSGGATSGIENAFISYDGFYKHGGPFPTELTIGAIDVPWTLDEPVGSPNILFMERPSSQVIATAFGGGDARTSLGFHSNDNRYWVGGFLTGPTTGALHTLGATNLGPQFAALGRVTYNIYEDPATNATLHIGANVADTFDPRGAGNVEGISLADRPELRIDPTSLLSTGTIPASGGQVYGAEAAATYGNAFIQGEYYHYVVETRAETAATTLAGGVPGPTADFNGGYVQGSYTFGGRRYYIPATGAYSGVIPDHPFILGSDSWGALEVAGRFDLIDLDSSALEQLAKTGTGYTGYTGGKQTSYGTGVTWYPNTNMRFMLDYEHVIVDNPTVFDGPSTKGATIDWIAARSQFVF
jgi:phosphate-selective porin OprO/OprP